MRMNKIILGLSLVSALASSAVFANKVELSAADTSGEFFCVVNTIVPFKKVDIHTDGVEVSGFCDGQEYVERSGHISGMPMSELQKFYFEYKKNLGRAASVDIVAENGEDITCFSG